MIKSFFKMCNEIRYQQIQKDMEKVGFIRKRIHPSLAYSGSIFFSEETNLSGDNLAILIQPSHKGLEFRATGFNLAKDIIADSDSDARFEGKLSNSFIINEATSRVKGFINSKNRNKYDNADNKQMMNREREALSLAAIDHLTS